MVPTAPPSIAPRPTPFASSAANTAGASTESDPWSISSSSASLRLVDPLAASTTFCGAVRGASNDDSWWRGRRVDSPPRLGPAHASVVSPHPHATHARRNRRDIRPSYLLTFDIPGNITPSLDEGWLPRAD